MIKTIKNTKLIFAIVNKQRVDEKDFYNTNIWNSCTILEG